MVFLVWISDRASGSRSFCYLLHNVLCCPLPKIHLNILYNICLGCQTASSMSGGICIFTSYLPWAGVRPPVSCGRVFEKSPLRVKNFGIRLRFDSRGGTHSTSREYRDLTPAGAVTQCYGDMGARPRARAHSVHTIKFPLRHRVRRRRHKPRFTTKRPNTSFRCRACRCPSLLK
ncbi:unnamed protein product [Nyctereutes procyonoides]|uniref:Large ribosomal subunit protein eL20 n=1 Tax=Nyctereutes procyonoides TaxID=34880 RepID=A0A811Y540_NYCPR|nr:unnamed protein product [Nyctereutes procyonoides]